MRSPSKTILVSGFIAGSLDLLTAILVYSILLKKITPIQILRSIASGVFKDKAYSGGIEMPIYGLIFHFLIAFSFAITYFFLFPYIPFLKKQKVISGILYGTLVWVIMNLVVFPLVFTKTPKMTFEFVSIGMTILIFMIGLPISFITHKYYVTSSKASA